MPSSAAHAFYHGQRGFGIHGIKYHIAWLLLALSGGAGGEKAPAVGVKRECV